MFAEDLISANLSEIFIGYTVEGSYNIKISRDADIFIDEEETSDLVETIKKKLKKRKIGDLSRFVYDKRMSVECLQYICETFNIGREDLIPDNVHLNMEDLIKLPRPYNKKDLEAQPTTPLRIPELDKVLRLFPVIRKKDLKGKESSNLPVQVNAQLVDVNGKNVIDLQLKTSIAFRENVLTLPAWNIPNVKAWSAEIPNLYTLYITLQDVFDQFVGGMILLQPSPSFPELKRVIHVNGVATWSVRIFGAYPALSAMFTCTQRPS